MPHDNTYSRKLFECISKAGKVVSERLHIIPADELLNRIVGKGESPEASNSMIHRTGCGRSITHVCNSIHKSCSIASFEDCLLISLITRAVI